MLAAVGLDEAEEAAYRALVALGAAEASPLAGRLARAVDETERALRGLERRGLAARSPSHPGRWVAAPPVVALGALLAQQRHELDRAELAAGLLAAEYRAEADESAAPDLVEVVVGVSAVAHRFSQLQLGAAQEVCALVTGTPVAVTGTENEAEERVVERGVTYRVVLEREALESPPSVVELAAALRRDQRVRVVERVPTKLVIADRSTAMVPLTSRDGAGPAAVVVHASGLLDSLLALFEAVWREALPLRLDEEGGGPVRGEAGGPDATDLRILSLLLAGLTDTSVGKHLGLGLRTVQRRVRRLMDLTGAATRLQLGWQAHERGWVRREP
ncbi:helix-turn-helix domain-containing protein [Streptomyces sp. SBT349]|uniref:helix-turn-helix domain-containing protein n=1 Tax=Streptomyces sp. SBT349 TaxID=1580539 RepID=UPI00066A93FC|nr:helix-turn-helix domain-containing protein [Streptomyces sp. SBT349]